MPKGYQVCGILTCMKDTGKSHDSAARHEEREREKQKEMRERLDERVRFFGGMLATFDEMAYGMSVGEDGEVIKQRQTIPFTVDKKRAFQPIQNRVVLSRGELGRRVREAKEDPLVRGADFVLGAMVIVYDSSIGVPEIIDQHTSSVEPGTRGFYKPRNDRTLGLVAVDLNVKLRHDAVSPTVSLVHELHHHNRAIADVALGLDGTFALRSASYNVYHQDLIDDYVGTRYPSFWDRVDHDREAYEALLDRKIPPLSDILGLNTVVRDIKSQQRYLDELHSSFLQKKPNWFSASAKVYSAAGDGFHHQLVGSHERDIGAVNDLLLYLQGMWCANEVHVAILRAPEAKRTELAQEFPDMNEFIATFPKTFTHVGALIGISRGVQQAERLVAGEWQKLKANRFVAKYIPGRIQKFFAVDGLTTLATDGRDIEDFLLGERR